MMARCSGTRPVLGRMKEYPYHPDPQYGNGTGMAKCDRVGLVRTGLVGEPLNIHELHPATQADVLDLFEKRYGALTRDGYMTRFCEVLSAPLANGEYVWNDSVTGRAVAVAYLHDALGTTRVIARGKKLSFYLADLVSATMREKVLDWLMGLGPKPRA